MNLTGNLLDLRLVFIDLETTGLDVVTGDAICEIGALKVKKRQVTEKFHSLVNPKMPVPTEAYRVHKITDQELENAPCFEEVADRLLAFLNRSVICAYNAGFDIGFINHHLKKMDYNPLNLPTIDILLMARDCLDLPRYNLEAVAKHLNIDCSGGLHRAIDDSLIAYQVFFKLVDFLAQKGVEKLEDFISLYGLSNEVYRIKENQKITLLKEKIEGKNEVKMRYFSADKNLKEEVILPLRVSQESKYFYLWYQSKNAGTLRIRLSRILSLNPFLEEKEQNLTNIE